MGVDFFFKKLTAWKVGSISLALTAAEKYSQQITVMFWISWNNFFERNLVLLSGFFPCCWRFCLRLKWSLHFFNEYVVNLLSFQSCHYQIYSVSSPLCRRLTWIKCCSTVRPCPCIAAPWEWWWWCQGQGGQAHSTRSRCPGRESRSFFTYATSRRITRTLWTYLGPWCQPTCTGAWTRSLNGTCRQHINVIRANLLLVI